MHCFVWFVVFNQFFGDEGGQLHRPAYEPIVWFCCVLVVAAILGCAWFTRDQIPTLKAPPDDGEDFSPRRLLLDMWDAVRNRHYLFLLLGLFFLSVMIGTHETLGIYMATFYLGTHAAPDRLADRQQRDRLPPGFRPDVGRAPPVRQALDDRRDGGRAQRLLVARGDAAAVRSRPRKYHLGPGALHRGHRLLLVGVRVRS